MSLHAPEPVLPADDRTLDTLPGQMLSSGSASDDAHQQPVELVRGSAPRLSTEIQSLLLQRLRVATLVLLGGFLVFTIRSNFSDLLGSGGIGEGDIVYSMRAVLCAILAVFSIVLWTRDGFRMRELRTIELVVFGMTMAVCVAMQHRMMVQVGEPDHHSQITTVLTASMVMYFAVVMIYGTFIPNSAPRAAVICAIFTLVPFAVLAYDSWQFEAIRRHVAGDLLMVFALVMGVAYSVAVYSSYTIGTLRKQAFRARQLGHYRLKQLLGSGGMGEVYLGEHQLLKRPCAIKTIRPGRDADQRALNRFEREVRSTARLTHPNTVEIFDYGSTEDGTFYYVMEYLPGLSLQEVVSRQGRLQPERAVHLLRQVCGALAEAHAAGLVHRDLKPSNVIATQRGGTYDVAKLLDFGLVLSLSDSEASLDGEGIVGSPMYMAPETLEGEHPDARGDIYSLGALAYFLFCGRPPFRGKMPLEIMRQHVDQQPIAPRVLDEGIPESIEAIILKCLSKNPADRYQTATELEAAFAGSGVGAWTQEQAARWWIAGPSGDHFEPTLEMSQATQS